MRFVATNAVRVDDNVPCPLGNSDVIDRDESSVIHVGPFVRVKFKL